MGGVRYNLGFLLLGYIFQVGSGQCGADFLGPGEGSGLVDR